jgi:asparagine synthase (glutamine-hydrolysing)
MCGILGSVNVEVGEGDLEAIRHRGPDSRGLIEVEQKQHKVYLGHTRLSIQDLSESGSQPMWSGCGNYCIIFNGEVYNHKELRATLGDIAFKGHSDTETILYYLIKNGGESCKKFNGIFSYAFLDKKRMKLVLSRDPFGVKPLYYYFSGNKLVFSSELKAIKQLVGSFEVCNASLYSFLKIRYDLSPQTLYKSVKKVRPGHILEFDLTSDLKVREAFYSFGYTEQVHSSANDLVERYLDLLDKAVQRQLLSDVPVSILLSGGVDSALLLAMMKKHQPEVDSFTVGFDAEHEESEILDARENARILGSNHSEILIREEDFFANFTDMNRWIEEPVASQSVVPYNFLLKRVHESGFKVALSGQGVDEQWGGYPRYNYQNVFSLLSPFLPEGLRNVSGLFKNDKLRRAIKAATSRDFAEQYIESFSFFDDRMIERLVNVKFKEEEKSVLKQEIEYRREILGIKGLTPAEQMMILDLRTNLADDLLLYTDKIAMRYSVELRVPYLDLDLVRFVESIPQLHKVTLKRNKVLHKLLAQKLLPKEIVHRKKKGFYVPRKKWLQSGYAEQLKGEIVLEKRFSSLFNTNEVARYFDLNRTGEKSYEDQVFSLSNLCFCLKYI